MSYREERQQVIAELRARLAERFVRAETLADRLINLRITPDESAELAVLVREFVGGLRMASGIDADTTSGTEPEKA